MIISMWSALAETTLYSDFVRKGKKRKYGQRPYVISLCPHPLACMPFLNYAGQVPGRSLCIGCYLYLECFSSRYLHSSLITSLKPFSGAAFSVRPTWTSLFNTVVSHHATPTLMIDFQQLLCFLCLPRGTYHLLPVCFITSLLCPLFIVCLILLACKLHNNSHLCFVP